MNAEKQSTDNDSIVFIVDDDASVRDALDVLLSIAGFRTKSYSSCESFLEDYSSARRGCLILDMMLPQMSGLELQKRLVEKRANLPVIMITAYADVKSAVTAMKTRVFDFIEKPFDETAIISAVRSALVYGEASSERHARRVRRVQQLERLTGREHQVFELLAEGRTNKEIGRLLDISPRTVEIHRARVMEKLEVQGLPELIRIALDSGSGPA